MLGEEKTLPEWTDAIRPEMYTNKDHQEIAMAIDEILGANEVPDLITVADRLRGWHRPKAASAVIEIASAASTTANLNYHSKLLVENYQRKKCSEAIESILKGFGGKQISEIREALISTADRLEPIVGGQNLTALRDEVKEVYKALVRADGDERRRSVRTNIESLDRKVFLDPGEQTILAGRPSMGKTALACNIARNVSERGQGAVVFFSLEMSKASLVRRLLSAEAKISGWKLAEAAKDGRLAESANKLYTLDLWLDDRPGLTIGAMRPCLQKFDKVALVVIDYLGLVRPGREERHDLRIGGITKATKAIAKEFNCHVMMLAQLNRSVENRNPPMPRLSDLRDSGNIEEDADNVMLLYRPGYYSDHADPEECQAAIAKQRNGPTGMVKLRWNRGTQTFGGW